MFKPKTRRFEGAAIAFLDELEKAAKEIERTQDAAAAIELADLIEAVCSEAATMLPQPKEG